MDAETIAYLDRKFGAIGAHFEMVETRLNGRLDTLEARQASLEARLDRFESTLAGLEARFDDRFTSIDEKLATLTLRLDQFEARTTADLSEIRQQLAYLTLRETIWPRGWTGSATTWPRGWTGSRPGLSISVSEWTGWVRTCGSGSAS